MEPAHDKQGFERTTVLSRLESRLLQMQKNFWLFFSSFSLSLRQFTESLVFLGKCLLNMKVLILHDVHLYRSNNCHKVGYVSKKSKKKSIPPAPIPGGTCIFPTRTAMITNFSRS